LNPEESPNTKRIKHKTSIKRQDERLKLIGVKPGVKDELGFLKIAPKVDGRLKITQHKTKIITEQTEMVHSKCCTLF
jgi:hypothetical protein